MAKSFLLLLLIPLHVLVLLLPSSISQTTETQALLEFKTHLNDPVNFLHNWVDGQSPCQFTGVTCDPLSGEVIGVSLVNMSLSGSISDSVFRLPRLTTLELGQNAISGVVPPELANCTGLQVLNLSLNALTGDLPDLSSLRGLRILDLSSNGFLGDFPLWVSELIGLVQLGLAANNFNEGLVPESLGNLKNLTYLFLANCNLLGEIPPSIFELPFLGTLDFSQNQISGEFPKAISNLRSLFKIELYQNNLTGSIPPEIANLNLHEIDISRNQMTGRLPQELGNLKNLTVFQIYQNSFWGEIPEGFGDLQFLKSFSIYENEFSGEVPANLGRFSPLNLIDISENNFSGAFPRFLCQGYQLQYLLALDNNFLGEFPDSYASCKSLIRFRISQNRFTGKVPDQLWGLPAAVIIDISDNNFNGGISSAIGSSSSVSQLYVQNNQLSGELPAELGNLLQLQKFIAVNNSFSGQIPSQIGNLNQLTSLHLEENRLSGPIPPELGKCVRLVELDLAKNSLSGVVPGTLATLASLNSLNISWNKITGSIPYGLQSLRLSSVDFSRNQLSGRVPSQLLVIAGFEAFSGNTALCIDGGEEGQMPLLDPQLGICNTGHYHKKSGKVLVFFLTVSALAIFFAGLVIISYKNFKLEELRRKRESDRRIHEDSSWKLESFLPTDLDADEISNLDEDNLLGSGATGKVYRLDLNKNRGTVAVKQIWSGKRAIVIPEIDILGKIKHRNILKLYACLTKGELNYLVFEFMPHGNLYQALRRKVKGGNPELDWSKRYKIAVGAAKGLMYLHHDCSPTIIHRDIKSTNILLDEDYEAKISDFGIAKVAEESTLTSFAGTHGYIAPELAYSLKLTEKSDTYSFGVVLLELLTGLRPTEPKFGEGRDIVSWVAAHLDGGGQCVCEVLDPAVSPSIEEDMIKVLKVAVLCTSKLPTLRPSMREVVNMLFDADPLKAATAKVKFQGRKE